MVITNGDLLKDLHCRVSPIQPFAVSKPQHWLIQAITYYLNQDPRFEEPNAIPNEVKVIGHLSLKKGIALFGPPGCGKTILLRIMFERLFRSEELNAQWREADKPRDFDYAFYSTNHSFLNEVGGVGDTVAKDYGTPIDAVYNFINDRHRYYEAQVRRNPYAVCKLHITSNLTSQQFLQRYDARLLDRLKEMCNILVLDFPSFRH